MTVITLFAIDKKCHCHRPEMLSMCKNPAVKPFIIDIIVTTMQRWFKSTECLAD